MYRVSENTKAIETYQQATEKATALPATHPLRLAIALAFGNFQSEVAKDAVVAVAAVKPTFEQAAASESELEGEARRIFAFLKRNIETWSSGTYTPPDSFPPRPQTIILVATPSVELRDGPILEVDTQFGVLFFAR